MIADDAGQIRIVAEEIRPRIENVHRQGRIGPVVTVSVNEMEPGRDETIAVGKQLEDVGGVHAACQCTVSTVPIVLEHRV